MQALAPTMPLVDFYAMCFTSLILGGMNVADLTSKDLKHFNCHALANGNSFNFGEGKKVKGLFSPLLSSINVIIKHAWINGYWNAEKYCLDPITSPENQLTWKHFLYTDQYVSYLFKKDKTFENLKIVFSLKSFFISSQI